MEGNFVQVPFVPKVNYVQVPLVPKGNYVQVPSVLKGHHGQVPSMAVMQMPYEPENKYVFLLLIKTGW